jgi:hypothetical protein
MDSVFLLKVLVRANLCVTHSAGGQFHRSVSVAKHIQFFNKSSSCFCLFVCLCTNRRFSNCGALLILWGAWVVCMRDIWEPLVYVVWLSLFVTGWFHTLLASPECVRFHSPKVLLAPVCSCTDIRTLPSVTGRYSHHDAYTETYPSPYDSSPFQTVPNSAADHWGSGPDMGQGGPHPHPAFLHSGPGRDALGHAVTPNGDTKPALQSSMLAGYSGRWRLSHTFFVQECFTLPGSSAFVPNGSHPASFEWLLEIHTSNWSVKLTIVVTRSVVRWHLSQRLL